MLQHPREDH